MGRVIASKGNPARDKTKKTMTSKITKTVGGHYELNATGATVAPGNRVAAGEGDDYDTGTIDSIAGGTAQVRWDSHVTTALPLDNADVRVIL